MNDKKTYCFPFNKSGEYTALNVIQNKWKIRERGLANVFTTYIGYLLHLVAVNCSEEIPEDIVNRYKVVDHKKLLEYFWDKYDFEYDDFQWSQNVRLKKLVERGHDDAERVFEGNFGTKLMQNIIWSRRNVSMTDKESYKHWIFEEWNVFRLECLRCGFSVKKIHKKNERVDNTPSDLPYYSWGIGFRIKPTISDRILCRLNGFKFESASFYVDEVKGYKDSLIETLEAMQNNASEEERSLGLELTYNEDDKLARINDVLFESEDNPLNSIFSKSNVAEPQKVGVSLNKNNYVVPGYPTPYEEDIMPPRYQDK